MLLLVIIFSKISTEVTNNIRDKLIIWADRKEISMGELIVKMVDDYKINNKN
jgi:hypothetical protein